jgi:hypothetical protein
MAEERGLMIDEESFEKAKQRSLEVSRGNGKATSENAVQLDVHDLGVLEAFVEVPKTRDDDKFRKSIRISSSSLIIRAHRRVFTQYLAACALKSRRSTNTTNSSRARQYCKLDLLSASSSTGPTFTQNPEDKRTIRVPS